MPVSYIGFTLKPVGFFDMNRPSMSRLRHTATGLVIPESSPSEPYPT